MHVMDRQTRVSVVFCTACLHRNTPKTAITYNVVDRRVFSCVIQTASATLYGQFVSPIFIESVMVHPSHAYKAKNVNAGKVVL